MKRFFDCIVLVIGGILAMCSKGETRQYEYDNGKGEVE